MCSCHFERSEKSVYKKSQRPGPHNPERCFLLIVTKGEMNCTRNTGCVAAAQTANNGDAYRTCTDNWLPGKEPVLKVKLRRRVEGPGKTAKHELAQDPGGGEDNPAVS